VADLRVVLAKLMKDLYGDRFLAEFDQKYDNRLIGQKTVYLLQKVFGFPFAYGFNWYISGPYCSAVAGELYAICGDSASVEQAASIRIKGKFQERLNTFKELVSEHRRVGLSEADWLELLAAIDFLSKNKGLDVSDPAHRSAIVGAVAKSKPKYKPAAIVAGIEALAELVL